MATLDIFNNDAFSVSRLTQLIIDIPRVPTQLGDERLFTEAGLPESYAAAICRRQYRCALSEASDKQVWCLVYTVRNRAAAAKQPAILKDRRAAILSDRIAVKPGSLCASLAPDFAPLF